MNLTDGHKSDTIQSNTDYVELSTAERKFITFCRKFGWGEILVKVRQGEPVFATVKRRDFKFD